MATFQAGGMVFTVTLNDAAEQRLRAAGFNLRRAMKSPKRMADFFFDHARFGAVLFCLVEDQIPPSWSPEKFAMEMVRAGEAPIEATLAAVKKWAETKGYQTGKA